MQQPQLSVEKLLSRLGLAVMHIEALTEQNNALAAKVAALEVLAQKAQADPAAPKNPSEVLAQKAQVDPAAPKNPPEACGTGW